MQLDKLLSKIRKKGDLDADLKELLAEQEELQQEAEKRCRPLGTDVDDYDEIVKLPVPLKETVEEYEGLFQAAGKKREHLENQEIEVRKRINRVDTDLAELEQKEEVLSESVLLEARARRDELWLKVKRGLAGR